MSKEEKEEVLCNLDVISVENLFDYILKGEISFKEMQENNLKNEKQLELAEKVRDFESSWSATTNTNSAEAYQSFCQKYTYGICFEQAQERIKTLEEERDRSEWVEAKEHNTIDAIKNYIMQNPNGAFVKEANALMEEIKTRIRREKEDFLVNLAEKSILDVQNALKNGIVSKDDIDKVETGLYEAINESPKYDFKVGEIPDSIPSGYTEVFLWGLPTSGKTCALAGIVYAAEKKGIYTKHRGTGFHYQTVLGQIFNNPSQIALLPGGNEVDKTQYLGFGLADNKGIKHKIALIEMSGEVFRACYKSFADQEIHTETHSSLKRITNYLKDDNPKLHFFVVDYSTNIYAINYFEGISQSQYLESAIEYIKSIDNFKTTDSIYILLTKSDLLYKDGGNPEDYIRGNYLNLFNRLMEINKKIGNNAEVKIIPFTLGSVYFRYLCKYNITSSLSFIEILQKETDAIPAPESIFRRILKFLRS